MRAGEPAAAAAALARSQVLGLERSDGRLVSLVRPIATALAAEISDLLLP